GGRRAGRPTRLLAEHAAEQAMVTDLPSSRLGRLGYRPSKMMKMPSRQMEEEDEAVEQVVRVEQVATAEPSRPG
ncbi:hypothetical protein Dimus_010288, partial [Dionaea muscipula]